MPHVSPCANEVAFRVPMVGALHSRAVGHLLLVIGTKAMTTTMYPYISIVLNIRTVIT